MSGIRFLRRWSLLVGAVLLGLALGAPPALASVSAAQSDFVLNVAPFSVQNATAGQVTAQVSSTTTYQINGTAYVGAAGLTALAALPANT